MIRVGFSATGHREAALHSGSPFAQPLISVLISAQTDGQRSRSDGVTPGNNQSCPVLTLWAAVVAERLSYDQKEVLTFGKAVAGLNAQSKGRRLGIFEEPKGTLEEKEQKPQRPGETSLVSLLHRRVPVIRTDHGVRATVKAEPIDPASARRYLAQKFGHVRAAMEAVAKAYPPDRLAAGA